MWEMKPRLEITMNLQYTFGVLNGIKVCRKKLMFDGVDRNSIKGRKDYKGFSKQNSSQYYRAHNS